MNLTQFIIILITTAIIFGGIGTIIHFAFGGYKALEFKRKSNLQNFVDGVIGFFKLFKQ